MKQAVERLEILKLTSSIDLTLGPGWERERERERSAKTQWWVRLILRGSSEQFLRVPSHEYRDREKGACTNHLDKRNCALPFTKEREVCILIATSILFCLPRSSPWYRYVANHLVHLVQKAHIHRCYNWKLKVDSLLDMCISCWDPTMDQDPDP